MKTLRLWLVEEDARLIRLFDFGWPLADIAIQMRRSGSSIRNRLGRLRRRGLVGRRRSSSCGEADPASRRSELIDAEMRRFFADASEGPT